MTPESTPSYAAEFLPITQGQCTIEDYRDRLCTLYTEPDMQHPQFDHWNMKELRTYKQKHTVVKHEYLVASFTDSTRETVHLCIQRQLQDASSPPPSIEQNNNQIKLFGMRVIDNLYLYPSARLDNDVLVEHIMFPEGHRISLPKFVFLACAVRECSRAYSLRGANPYWFCFAMMKALKVRYPKRVSLPVQARKQVAWSMLLVDKFCHSANVDELLARTDQMWNQYVGQLQIPANVL